MNHSFAATILFLAGTAFADFPGWTATDAYKDRLALVDSLGAEAGPEKVEGLLRYLAARDESLRPDLEAGLKNQIWNVLVNQAEFPTNLAVVTVSVFRAGEQTPAVLDYCLQHLPAMAALTEDVWLRGEIRACVESGTLDPSRPWAGTALIALTHLPAPTNSDRTFLLSRILALVSDPATHSAARATALQIGAEQGFSGLLPHVRAILADPSHHATLHISALAALGALGDAADIPALDAFAAAHPHSRFHPALAAARKKLTEKESR